MGLKDQVCSLESAKRLKELGVIGSHVFVWRYEEEESEFILNDSTSGDEEWYPAFTVTELGEMLPTHIDHSGTCFILTINRWDNDNKWQISYVGGEYNDDSAFNEFIADDLCEAEARAKMIIHLIEEGKMKYKKLHDQQK